VTTALVVAVAVLVVAWLTASAAAVRSVSRIWLRHWAERGGRGSAVVASYLERPTRLLLAASTAVMLTASLAGVALGATATGRPLATAARVAVAALALLLLGQLVPRAVGRRWGVALVPVLVPVLRLVDVVLGPPADAVRRFAARGAAHAVPEDEQRDALEDLLREGELEGVSAGEEAAIISGVVQFGEKRVADVMTPRADIFALDAALPMERIVREVAQSGYSRVPMYEGTIDDPVGMVRVFDIIMAAGAPMPWRPIAEARPEAYCNELLARMLRAQLHMVLVRDADGRTLGLVTLEDLLEELVGDIRDEHDEPQRSGPLTPPLGAARVPGPPRS